MRLGKTDQKQTEPQAQAEEKRAGEVGVDHDLIVQRLARQQNRTRFAPNVLKIDAQLCNTQTKSKAIVTQQMKRQPINGKNTIT